MGVKIDSVPHDLLKVANWRGHSGKSAIKDFFPEIVRGKYRIPYKDIEGKVGFRTLEQVIEGHHSKKAFWESLWSYADKLSTPAGRFRLEYDYWYWSDANPFLVKVYGDMIEWSREERSKIAKAMINILEKYCGEEGEQHKAFEEINDLLGDYPSDSRFPYTSLKTHHWLTDAIRRNEIFWRKCSSARSMGKEPEFNNLYIVRVSISEVQFHRLKEIRGFIELRGKILEIARGKLSGFSPLQIGDDLYIVCLKEDELNSIISSLTETGFGFDVSVFEWSIAREEKYVGLDDEPEHIYIIKDASERPQISVGIYEDFEYIPESSAEYSRILEGDYEYVAWVSIEPKGDMKDLSQKFLEWGEGKLKSRYGDRCRELKEPVREPTAILSPEIALSVAEGYDEFLEDCAKAINPANPKESMVVKSFGRTIFVRGLKEPSEAFQIYNNIAGAKARLHIPSVFSVVTAKPKYPFWRILELFRSDADCLVFIVGEKMSELTDKHARLIKNVIEDIRNERKRQFYKIVNSARKDSKEILKVKINGLASEKKLKERTASNLCKIVDDIAGECSGDEERRKRITYEVFKILRMFASAR